MKTIRYLRAAGPTACLLSVILLVAGCGHKNTPLQPDLTPPPPIEVLKAVSLSDSSIQLYWLQPDYGGPAKYEVGYTTDPLALVTEGGWKASTKVSFAAANTYDFTVFGLKEATTYFFAMRSYDLAGNVSSTSILASARTDEAPPRFSQKWGSQGSGPGQFLNPSGIVVGTEPFSGREHLYVADAGNYRIQSLDPLDGTFVSQWGSKCDLTTGEGCVDPDGSGPLEIGDGQFGRIEGIAADYWGNVYVADWTNHRIVKFDINGNFLAKWPVVISVNGTQFDQAPSGIDIDPDGEIYVLAGKVIVYNLSGTVLGAIDLSLPNSGPYSMASDGRGDIYLATLYSDNGSFFKISKNGALLGRWGGGSLPTCARGQLFVPEHIGVDALGNVYVPDGCGRAQKFDANGTFLTSWGTSGAGDGQFDLPRDIVIDSDRLYVLEDSDPASGRSQTRIQMFYSSHTYPRAMARKYGDRAVSSARR